MSISVRTAVSRDIDWLVEQLREFDKFVAHSRSFIEDEEFARRGLLQIVNDHVCFIAEEHGAPLGFIAGYSTPHPFNPKIRVLSECFWWVDQRFRSSRAGAMLLQEFTDYGRRYCDWVVMSLESVSPVKPESLVKRGFKLKESAYLMEV